MVVYYHGMPLNSVEGIAANVWYEEPDGEKVDLQTKTTLIVNSINQEISDRRAAIQNEITDRTRAVNNEAELRQTAISNEATARSNEDSRLAQLIQDEATARANADTAEASARQTAVSNEATARANADSQLRSAIDSKVKNSGSNVSSINFALSGNSLSITTS